MEFLTVFFIAVGLAMDAFAVSISNGAVLKGCGNVQSVKVGFFFGGFQFLMPVAGWILGSSVKEYIEAFDHWIAFILLFVIGLNMIKESFFSDECGEHELFISNKKLAVQAIATSIDALAVGVSFGVLNMNIVSAASVIGMVCFIFSFIGMTIGRVIGSILKNRAEFVGGVILIVIGVRILLEHIFAL